MTFVRNPPFSSFFSNATQNSIKKKACVGRANSLDREAPLFRTGERIRRRVDRRHMPRIHARLAQVRPVLGAAGAKKSSFGGFMLA